MLKIEKNRKCPYCLKDTATMSFYTTNEQDNKIKISTVKCDSCMYKSNDTVYLDKKSPKKYILKISGIEDLDTKIIKSQDSDLEIVELGLSLESSIFSDGFITNIEGVLNKFLERLNILKEENSSKNAKIKDLKSKIQKVKKGELEITLILKDNSGNSKIISDKALELELD